MNQEAMRCLLCPVPMCSTKGCPIHTPVPQAMKLYREGKPDEAGKLVFDNNPLSAVTSRICDWQRFCYGHCVLNARKQPVRWYEIEQEISAAYLKNHHETKSQETIGTAAIIGGGPAGIAAAIRLARQGVAVTIYDQMERVGGVLRYGIPEFRLERTYVDSLERILLELCIHFVGHTKLGSDCLLDSLMKHYDAVLLAAGAEKARTLRIPGETRPHVFYAVEWLKKPDASVLGDHVIVIGGGNVAMDACRTAKRMGRDVQVFYRKTFENMPANPLEVEEAQKEGIPFHVFQAPVEVRGHSVVFRDCENDQDEHGKTVTRILDGTDHEVKCDTLLVAAGESVDYSLFGDVKPQMDERGWLKTGEHGKIEGLANVFAAGDFLLGARTVVEAAATGNQAADGMLEVIRNKTKEA
ncbi:MAG: FAD-dependent oxidoreductase [Galactobacillus timonensis]|uniref:FAD-dependent oxidoreductase n=1 Tax=Galactobacillus timonensis TaxID=2041840 RepID=UPI0024092582|nr:FAD-dependent oxidoreductase [Galactobacillus timonensis]MDD6599430.1 FAD-dependent oxidoreductase [Galactobacillus timonensis]